MTTRLRLLAVVSLASSVALAGGGDDHDHGPAKAAAPAAAGPSSTAGEGELYEVLVRYAPAAPQKTLDLQIFVADVGSNEPVAGAEVELTVTGKQAVTVAVKATDRPGIYAATFTPPAEGEYDVVASVTRGDDADLVAVGAIRSGLPEGDAAHAEAGRSWLWTALAALLTAAILGVAVFAGLRVMRARRKPAEEIPHA